MIEIQSINYCKQRYIWIFFACGFISSDLRPVVWFSSYKLQLFRYLKSFVKVLKLTGSLQVPTEKKPLNITTKTDVKAVKEPPNPEVQVPAGDESNKVNTAAARKSGGVHQVLSLDVTSAPRDANAVGQFGQAAMVASNEEAEVRKRWDEGHFNVYLSDQIPVDRAIPDTRPEM